MDSGPTSVFLHTRALPAIVGCRSSIPALKGPSGRLLGFDPRPRPFLGFGLTAESAGSSVGLAGAVWPFLSLFSCFFIVFSGTTPGSWYLISGHAKFSGENAVIYLLLAGATGHAVTHFLLITKFKSWLFGMGFVGGRLWPFLRFGRSIPPKNAWFLTVYVRGRFQN